MPPRPDPPPPVTPAQAERFERLAWPHLPMLVRTAQYLCRDTQLGEDLAQEAMLKALRAIERFQDGTDIKAWLLSILRHAVIDAARSRQRRAGDVSLEEFAQAGGLAEAPQPEPGRHDEEWTDPQRIFEQLSDRQMIAALQSLPAEIRWTLLLVDVEQLDHAAAAEVLGVPVGTIKSRAHRGRAMLRDRLRGDAKSGT